MTPDAWPSNLDLIATILGRAARGRLNLRILLTDRSVSMPRVQSAF